MYEESAPERTFALSHHDNRVVFSPGPLFVFQWLYDHAKIAFVVSGTFRMPDDAHKQKHIHGIALQLGVKLRKSLNRTKDLAW